jgi:hypothetical protein
MKLFITLILLTLLAITPATANPPAITVDSEQQAARDHEKLNILHNEINEQRQITAQLQQQRAIDLANGNQNELAKTEARLEEVSGNITQIQQEINLAQGQLVAIKPVTVRLNPQQGAEATTIAQKEAEQPNNPSGQWWDLYNKKKN